MAFAVHVKNKIKIKKLLTKPRKYVRLILVTGIVTDFELKYQLSIKQRKGD